jgi:apyrase
MADKMWRFRGILAVASVPLFLILAVVTLMPSAPEDSLDFSSHGHVQDRTLDARGTGRRPNLNAVHDARAHARGGAAPLVNAAGGGGIVADTRKYAVVFDAGSTGSRVHVFRFDVEPTGDLVLLDDTFEQLKPGLSSFASDPEQGAASLKPLLEVAMRTVPEAARAATTVEVRATAGLRMLPGAQAENLLQATRALLGDYPFVFEDDGVSIMDGAEEGAFQWLTMNYLLGNLRGDLGDTVATVDLGGGSVQLAYAADAKHVAGAPEGYFKDMKSGDFTYHVYVHSHLGFGLMAARAAVLKEARGEPSPCVPAGHRGEYAYGGETHAVAGHASEPADAARCKAVVDRILDVSKPCAAREQDHCSFAGAWDGSRGAGARSFYLSSYLFDRVSQAGLVDPDRPSGVTTPGEILVAAKRACGMSPNEIVAEFHGVAEADAAYYCHDLSYAHSLLVVGYRLDDSTEVTLVKQIVYKGQNIEAAWPLGAAINALSVK